MIMGRSSTARYERNHARRHEQIVWYFVLYNAHKFTRNWWPADIWICLLIICWITKINFEGADSERFFSFKNVPNCANKNYSKQNVIYVRADWLRSRGFFDIYECQRKPGGDITPYCRCFRKNTHGKTLTYCESVQTRWKETSSS